MYMRSFFMTLSILAGQTILSSSSVYAQSCPIELSGKTDTEQIEAISQALLSSNYSASILGCTSSMTDSAKEAVIRIYPALDKNLDESFDQLALPILKNPNSSTGTKSLVIRAYAYAVGATSISTEAQNYLFDPQNPLRKSFLQEFRYLDYRSELKSSNYPGKPTIANFFELDRTLSSDIPRLEQDFYNSALSLGYLVSKDLEFTKDQAQHFFYQSLDKIQAAKDNLQGRDSLSNLVVLAQAINIARTAEQASRRSGHIVTSQQWTQLFNAELYYSIKLSDMDKTKTLTQDDSKVLSPLLNIGSEESIYEIDLAKAILDPSSENLYSQFLASRGINKSHFTEAQKQLIDLIFKEPLSIANNAPGSANDVMNEFAEEFDSDWSEFKEDHELNSESLKDFPARKTLAQLDNVISVIDQVMEEISHRSEGFCSGVQVPISMDCIDGEVSGRSELKTAYNELRQQKLRAERLNYLISIAVGIQNNIFNDIEISYETLQSLKSSHNPISSTFTRDLLNVLQAEMDLIIKRNLRKEFVEIVTERLPINSSLVSRKLNHAQSRINAAYETFNILRQAENSQTELARLEAQKKITESTISSLKDRLIQTTSDFTNRVNANKQQEVALEDKVSELESRIMSSEWAITKLCDEMKGLKGSIPVVKYQRKKCKNVNDEIPTPSEMTYIWDVFDVLSSKKRSIEVSWTDENKKMEYFILRKQHKLLTSQMSRAKKDLRKHRGEEEFQKQGPLLDLVIRAKKASEQSLKSEIRGQQANLKFLNAAITAGKSKIIPEGSLQKLVDLNLEKADSYLELALQGIAYYQKALGRSPTVVDQDLLSQQRSIAGYMRINELKHSTILQLNEVWQSLNLDLTKKDQNLVSRKVIPITPFMSSKTPSKILAEQRSLLTEIKDLHSSEMEENNPHLFGLNQKITECVASYTEHSMNEVMEEVGRYEVGPGMPALPSHEDDEPKLAYYHKLLTWKQMPQWYGHVMRASEGQRSRVQLDASRVWALWKYHKSWQRLLSQSNALNDHNQNSDSFDIRSILSYKLGYDLFKDAEASFITGIYPVNVMGQRDDVYVDNRTVDYFVNTCTALDPISQESYSCGEKANFDFGVASENSLYMDLDKSFWREKTSYRTLINILDNSFKASQVKNPGLSGQGANFAHDLFGMRPNLEFSYQIDNIARFEDYYAFYGASYVIIEYVTNKAIDHTDSMMRKQFMVYPKLASEDKNLSDVYQEGREGIMFSGKNPVAWLLEKSTVPECIALEKYIEHPEESNTDSDEDNF